MSGHAGAELASVAAGPPASSEQWTARYSAALMNTFGTPRRVLVRGEGPYVWDADGRRYLDLLGGIAVTVARPRAPDAHRGDLRAAGHPRARVELLRHPHPGRARRAAADAVRGAGGVAGVLHELRDRGRRGHGQDDPAHRPDPDPGPGGLVPRPNHGCARADPQGGLPGAVRAAARWGGVPALRRPRSPRGRDGRRRRRDRPRAHPGGGRRAPARRRAS